MALASLNQIGYISAGALSRHSCKVTPRHFPRVETFAYLRYLFGLANSHSCVLAEVRVTKNVLLIFSMVVISLNLRAQTQRLEEMHGKTILVFTPHPDDDVFGAGGTIA